MPPHLGVDRAVIMLQAIQWRKQHFWCLHHRRCRVYRWHCDSLAHLRFTSWPRWLEGQLLILPMHPHVCKSAVAVALHACTLLRVCALGLFRSQSPLAFCVGLAPIQPWITINKLFSACIVIRDHVHAQCIHTVCIHGSHSMLHSHLPQQDSGCL